LRHKQVNHKTIDYILYCILNDIVEEQHTFLHLEY